LLLSQFLFPFQGSPIDHDGYHELVDQGRTIFERSSIRKAHFAALPFDGFVLLKSEHPTHAAALQFACRTVEQASEHGLKTLVVANIDSTLPLPLPQQSVVVLRPSLLASDARSNEYALPAWHDDLFARYCGSKLRIRAWRQRPSVGFCGLAGRGRPPLTRRVKIVLQKLGFPIPHNDGVWLRAAAMRHLDRSGVVSTAFIVRDGYFEGPRGTDEDREQIRQEYVNNILDNDYALCVRGWGNHSFRTYEALSLGRPLLFLDTDCILPLEELVDYDGIVVRVPERDLKSVAHRLLEFHGSLDESSFGEVQRSARSTWENFLSPLSYYRCMASILLDEHR
jgi:hypothetical protein